MNKIFLRTTQAERDLLKLTVNGWIESRQSNMDKDIQVIKKEYRNIRKVTAKKYNPTNLFKELGISNLLVFYYHAISDREAYHVKNSNYKLLKKTFGL